MPPPTDFVLRARHVAFLTLFILTFKEYDGKLPPTFLLHLYRVLLNEVVEAAPPKSYQELLQELRAGAKSEEDYPRQLIESFDACREGLSTAEHITNFFAGLPSLFIDKAEADEEVTINSPLHRRSVFGYFCRRCFVSFLKLSFYGVGKLQKEYEAWCKGEGPPTAEFPVVKDELHSDTHIFRTVADRIVWAQPDAYDKWDKALAAGDESTAVENLRRYFEQHFHENNDSGFRQQSLLNLVRMHYLRQEFVAARKLLSEAIGVARTTNDKVTLQQCISLLHRLPGSATIERRRPMLNQIQADLHPMEVLFDVQKLMDEENGQPLSASFVKIVQGMGLYDHWNDTQAITPPDSEQWAQHTVQSVVWAAAGCEQLSIIQENLVIAFTDVGGDDNNRITAILNQAYRGARQGKYDESLSTLLHPSVWRGLSIADYGLWAHEIWHILALWVTRRGQDRAYREILLPRRPPGEFKPRLYSLVPDGLRLSKIQDPLWETIQMQHCDQATSAIDGLLTALWHSEFLGRLNSYRTGIILLADVGLEYGMSKRSRYMVEEIMPQIISGEDLEQRALACFTLARTIIVAGESTADSLREAVPYLLKAEEDFGALEMHRAVMDVQYFLAVVYHNLGLQTESDGAAQRHRLTQGMRSRLESSDEGISEVLEVVRVVGAALACG